MNIKYITNVRIPTPRAQGYAIMKMCSEFSRASVETELFVPERSNSQSKRDPFDFYGIENSFEIKRIPSFDFLGLTKSFGKFFYWIDILSFFISLKFYIKIDEEDILYTRDFLTLLFFSRNKKIFLELHNIPNSKLFFRWLIKKPKAIFVLNNNLKKELVDIGVSDNKIFVSPSGVDISDFDIDINKIEARKKLDLSQEKEIVVYTGHLYDWKGVNTLAQVAKFIPEVLFVFVGGIVPEINEFTKRYKEYKNIIVRPFVERSIIPTYLKSADVLVVPNSSKEKISSQYTSPLKLFEYMASSRPIVASSLPSIKEILNTNNCVFAEADNVESFTKSIKRVLEEKEKSQTMVEQAFKDVNQYTWQKRVSNILNHINEKSF